MNEQQKTPKQPEEDMTPDVTDQEQPAAEAPQEPAPQADAPDVDALKKAAAKADEYLALAQRVQADFDNFRRRNEGVRADAFAEGQRKVATRCSPCWITLNARWLPQRMRMPTPSKPAWR